MKTLISTPVAVLVLLAGCTSERRGEPVSETKSVDAGKVELVRVDVRMGAGELRIESGGPKLFEGTFNYDSLFGKPEVRYEVTGFRGRLNVYQPTKFSFPSDGDGDNRWDLKLGGETPMDLNINMGAGEGKLRLGGLNLRTFEIKIGAGELDVDLRGEWKKDVDVRIHGGVGEATVHVPNDIGIRAEARGGIGEINVRGLEKSGNKWVNSLYEDSKVTLRLEVAGGIGQINIIAE